MHIYVDLPFLRLITKHLRSESVVTALDQDSTYNEFTRRFHLKYLAIACFQKSLKYVPRMWWRRTSSSSHLFVCGV